MTRGVVAGVFSVLAFLFGLPFLIHGVIALVTGIGQPMKFSRSDDFYMAAVGLPIALICLAMSIRWGKRWLSCRTGK